MDPFTLGMLTSALGDLVARAISRTWHVLTDDSPQVTLPTPNSAFAVDFLDEVILTEAQFRKITQVLNHPNILMLVEAACYIRALYPSEAQAEQFADLKKSFGDVFSSAIDNESIFEYQIEPLWTALVERIDELLPEESSGTLSSEERNQLLERKATLPISGGSASHPRWLRRYLEVATDIALLSRVAERSREIRSQAAGRFGNMDLHHSLESHTDKTLGDLYIQRDLQTLDGENVPTREAIGLGRRVRAVVTGHPGNGKSTLTQRIMTMIADESESHAPLLIRVRELNAENLILDELVTAVQRLYQDTLVDRSDVETLLLLGRAYVIFDGLDEALEKSKRIKVVEQIQSFSRQYPLSAILVTCREVGYEDAPLDRTFGRFRLRPFTLAQTREYAEKWFSSEEGGLERVEPFMKEVAASPELAENPLMLSLLCALYKNRGHIPRNRRSVYSDCADLLFRRWDSMRDIDQPADHINHGQDIMEEIAMFFFRSESVQAGIEERQLRDVIAGYLRDSAGVLQGHSRQRASAFLEFCADRAWLLGVDGSRHGERVFVFTHRTFMEYFAAEGTVRTISDTARIADIIYETYRKNPGSVLPELIVSAAEAGQRDRVRDIINALKEKERIVGTLLPLRLRIAGVLNLRPRHLDEMIEEAFLALSSDWNANATTISSHLFALPRNPRERVGAYALNPSEIGKPEDAALSPGRTNTLLRAWAEFSLETGVVQRGHEWEELLGSCWSQAIATGDIQDEWTRFYGKHYLGIAELGSSLDRKWFAPAVGGAPRPAGKAILSAGILEGTIPPSLVEVHLEMDGSEKPRFSYDEAKKLYEMLAAVLAEANQAPLVDCPESRRFALICAMVTWELTGRFGWVLEELEALLGFSIASLVSHREENRIADAELDLLEAELEWERLKLPRASAADRATTKRSVNALFPRWAKNWMTGRVGLLGD
ncbi:NACHT domain-containing protein [Nocardioides jishulii]|uniref:NACHT domain-containing protein n=1 Tax=Nocardioides jishulii TaxID=2575440 RepID=UPI001484D578|nr:NACHT domain-containing protein [Nocardioides jishulii]